MREYSQTFTARAADIDELGHVNNAVWVRWVQDLATAHWAAAATDGQATAYVWVVVRHEVDYMGNLKEGESVAGRTWVAEAAVGAKFDRFVFRGELYLGRGYFEPGELLRRLAVVFGSAFDPAT